MEFLYMKDKILTISIASYNAEKDISRCLESMIKTSVFDYLDIIVVNDGSTDKTSEIASKYAIKFPNSIRLIDKKNGGHGSTINVGILEAKGKYFKIVDSDDWVDKDGIENLVNFLSVSDVDLVMNPYHTINFNSLKRVDLIDPCPQYIKKNDILLIEQLRGYEELYMHSMTFKTEIMQKVGPVIDEHCFYVDMEYCIYPLVYTKSVCYLETPVYQYLLGSQTQSVSVSSIVKRRNEHKRVLSSLINFYVKNFIKNSNYVNSVKNIIYKRISQAIETQYVIYLFMGGKIAKREMDDFSNFLKNFEFEFPFSNTITLKSIFMAILISSNTFTFLMLSLFYKNIKKIW